MLALNWVNMACMIYFSSWFRERALGLIFTVAEFPSFFLGFLCAPLQQRGLAGVGLLAFPTWSHVIFAFLIFLVLQLGLRDSVFYFTLLLGEKSYYYYHYCCCCCYYYYFEGKANIWPMKVSVLGSRLSLKYEIQKLCSFLKSRDFYRWKNRSPCTCRILSLACLKLRHHLGVAGVKFMSLHLMLCIPCVCWQVLWPNKARRTVQPPLSWKHHLCSRLPVWFRSGKGMR